MVGFPYTKYLNSVIRVNMASAFILMSQAKADELKVAENKKCMYMVALFSMIFGTLLNDLIFILPLQSKTCVNQSLDQADISLSDIKTL